MSSDIPVAPQVGEMAEEWAAQEFEFHRENASHYDCVAPADNVPVEVKSCQRWVSSGDGRERGRFRLWHDSHERLVEDDGQYLFVVTERDGDTFWPWRHVRVDAAGVTDIVSWQDYTFRERKGDTALLSWPYVIESEQSAIEAKL